MSRDDRRAFLKKASNLCVLGFVHPTAPAKSEEQVRRHLGAPPSTQATGPQKDRAENEAGVRVASLEEVPPGAALEANYKGLPLIILNVAADEDDDHDVRAFSRICTHEGCTVEWDADSRIIRCPCHAAEFDREGKVLAGPPPAPLLRFDVLVKGGSIYVVEKEG